MLTAPPPFLVSVAAPVPRGGPVQVRVVILYDRGAARDRAMQALERWQAAHAGRFTISPVLWRLDQAARLLARCHAADDVAEADLVLFSFDAPAEVPVSTHAWLQGCLERKPGDYLAALTLLSGAEHSRGAAPRVEPLFPAGVAGQVAA